MTHTIIIGQEKGKRSMGIETFVPVTILECPPIRIASLRLYKKQGTGEVIASQLNFKTEKDLARKMSVSKDKYSSAEDIDKIKPEEYSDITVQIYTFPRATGLKKTPEIFEVELGGSNKDKLEYIKANINRAIPVNEVFSEGQLVDAHSITKGKGFQGPVKRFGVGLKNHKSEKGVRSVGSLGGWKAQAHVMYRVAHAGQTGFHQRAQYNNLVMKISDKPEEVNPSGGIIHYGEIKTTYVLIKGTLGGAKKRLITLTEPVRPKKVTFSSDSIKMISKQSQQGR
jgi:large subunit ribosomal protein L3